MTPGRRRKPSTIKPVPSISFAIPTAINARTIQPRLIPNLGPTLLVLTLLNTIVQHRLHIPIVHRSDDLVEQEVGEDYDVDVDGGAEDSETEFGFGSVRAVLKWVVGGRCEPFVSGVRELEIYSVFFRREKAGRKLTIGPCSSSFSHVYV
jgi:hypothetical protein